VTDLELPHSAADLDRDWIASALERGGLSTSATIESVSVGPLSSAAVGLIGELVSCNVTWSGADDGEDLPTSIVIKLPSTNEGNRALALAMGYYHAEHHFYRSVAVDSGMRTPRCWYSDGDAESGRYALLIEDVGHLDVVDQSVGLDATKAESVLRRLAELHGRNWLNAELEGLDWLPNSYGEDLRVYGLLMNDAWPSWASAVADVVDPADLALAERFVTSFDLMIDALADEPWTLVHRDFRVDNMMFDGDDPVVFDWGAVARGNNLYDVAYFLGGSLDTPVRRAAQDQLLGSYRDALADAGGITYDDADFERVLRLNGLYCLIVPILGGGNVLDAKDDRGAELLATMLKRTFELLHDLDAGAELPA
jgi:hypothetical protein